MTLCVLKRSNVVSHNALGDTRLLNIARHGDCSPRRLTPDRQNPNRQESEIVAGHAALVESGTLGRTIKPCRENCASE
jgi:hypothetical protein